MKEALVFAGMAVSLVLATTAAAAADSGAQSWPTWRGPNRDAICTESGLLQQWPEDGPPLRWRIDDALGSGYSSVSVADGRIFTMGQRGKAASIIALRQSDGKELWRAEVGPGSPNCTPTVAGDLVYALGRKGDLVCVEAETGDEVWRKNYGRDFSGRMMSGWGYSESPLVDGDRLICTPGADDAMIAALDRKTGEVIWKAAMPEERGNRGKDGAGYSSVVVSNAAGIRQYIQLVGRGVVSVAADDGRFLWSYNRVANGTANIPTPLVDGDYVFCSSGYGTGAALLKIVSSRSGMDGQVDAQEVYFFDGREMQNHHGGMVLVDGYIYCGHGHNNGFPLCVEMTTGEVAWRPGRGEGSGSAAILYADGHIYLRYQDGVMALIEATPEEYRVKGTFRLPSNNGRSWPHPVIADGRLYLRDQGTLLCYDVRSDP